MKQSMFRKILTEEVKKYREILEKALKKFKIDSIYDLSYYKDPDELLEFMTYLNDQFNGDVDDQDKPVYTKENPEFHHKLDLTTGKLPTSITNNAKLTKVPKKLDSRVAVQEGKLNETGEMSQADIEEGGEDFM